MRVEHVVPSRCREDFLERRAKHEELKKDAKEQGSALLGPFHLFLCLSVLVAIFQPFALPESRHAASRLQPIMRK